MSTTSELRQTMSLVERIGKKIPDPVIIFMFLLVACTVITALAGGFTFQTQNADGGTTTHIIKNMTATEHVRWMFDNALVNNWLAFGNGVLGVILIVMLGVGVAEQSGLLTAVIKKLGMRLSDRFLAPAVVFLGIMSSIATDAGYLILVPLSGLLYAGLGKNPLIGMAAAFAGVSAGFSANLIPATPIDVIIGMNAKVFAEAQGVPFTRTDGSALSPATMHYYFIVFSTFLLAGLGAWVTNRFVAPKLETLEYQVPDDLKLDDFNVSTAEQKGLTAALWGLLLSLGLVALLATGPLSSYTDASDNTVSPYLDNVILLIALVFTLVGVFYGYAAKTFSSISDVVHAMVSQMNTMGYILVLTFFCYNFLGLLGYSGLGTYITYVGASFLQWLGLQQYPMLLIVGFIFTTALINLFVGGLTSKWMLLGPIFVPMLYQVNPQMTPDLVAAAYRVADSSTNIITPMMTYAGIILAFMRKYKPDLSFGDLILMMVPYSITFLLAWSGLLLGFFALGIPLGF